MLGGSGLALGPTGRSVQASSLPGAGTSDSPRPDPRARFRPDRPNLPHTIATGEAITGRYDFTTGQQTVVSLNLPAGNYEIYFTLSVTNGNAAAFQDNSRDIFCDLDGDRFFTNINGGHDGELAWHKASVLGSATTISASCKSEDSNPTSSVYIGGYSLTAISMGSINIQ